MDDASIAAAVASLGPVPAGPASALVRLLGGWIEEIDRDMAARKARRDAEMAEFREWRRANRDAIAAAACRPPGPDRAPF
jgi:hypothetical protein